MSTLPCWKCDDRELEGDWLFCPRCGEIKVAHIHSEIKGREADALHHQAGQLGVGLVIWLFGVGLILGGIVFLALQPFVEDPPWIAGLPNDGFVLGFWVGGTVALGLLAGIYLFRSSREAKKVRQHLAKRKSGN